MIIVNSFLKKKGADYKWFYCFYKTKQDLEKDNNGFFWEFLISWQLSFFPWFTTLHCQVIDKITKWCIVSKNLYWTKAR